MDEAAEIKFDTRAECEAHFLEVVARSKARLAIFDPDCSVFPLGTKNADAALRHFLSLGGHIQIVMHKTDYVERNYPRFLTLLQDYSHRIECRVTNRPLRMLTDSFCIGDDDHIVRRFHSDHMRGAAAFDSPAATEISNERFIGIWAESMPGLHATTTGL